MMIRLALAFLLASSPAWAADPVTYQGTVVKVLDGDTVSVLIPGWPAVYTPAHVRLLDLDTPESRMPPAKCTDEVRRGLIAKAWAKKALPIGSKVAVIWAGKPEKYGRVLGSITMPSGKDFAKEQIRVGNARPYDGKAKSDWCR